MLKNIFKCKIDEPFQPSEKHSQQVTFTYSLLQTSSGSFNGLP